MAVRKKARAWISLVKQGIDPTVEEERLRQETVRNQAITFAVAVDDFKPRADSSLATSSLGDGNIEHRAYLVIRLVTSLLVEKSFRCANKRVLVNWGAE